MAYSITLWGSDRKLGNDDCATGIDGIATLEEARESLAELIAKPAVARYGWQFAYVDGPEGEIEKIANPDYRDTPDDYGADDSEFAMQQGMSHGVDAYNDAIGSPLRPKF